MIKPIAPIISATLAHFFFLASSILIYILVISFSYLIAQVKTILSRYVETEHFCVVPDFSGIALSFFPFNLKLAIGVCGYKLPLLCLCISLVSVHSPGFLS